MELVKHGRAKNISFDLLELNPLEYEAIYRGLELLEQRPDLQKGIHAPKMLDAMKQFKAAEPKESEGRQ